MREAAGWPQPTRANKTRATGMAHDAPDTGRGIRILTLADGHTRAPPASPANTSISSRLITRVTGPLFETRRTPGAIRRYVPSLPVGTRCPGGKNAGSG